MTREEAIKTLRCWQLQVPTVSGDYKAFAVAINALEAMDNAHNTGQHVECIGEKIRVPMLEDAIKFIAWYCAKHSCSGCLLAKGDDDECIRFSIPCDWIDWFEEGDR